MRIAHSSLQPTRSAKKSSLGGTKRGLSAFAGLCLCGTQHVIGATSILTESGMEPIGRRRWAIAEGYIPSQSSYSDRELISHETACILNAGDKEAHVSVTIFFANREPVIYRVAVAPRRTLHLRFNDLQDPELIPRDLDYSSVFESDVPIVVQHTRLDSRHAEVSLLSTTAYAEP